MSAKNEYNRCLECENCTRKPNKRQFFRYICDCSKKNKLMMPDGKECQFYTPVGDSDNHFDTFFPY